MRVEELNKIIARVILSTKRKKRQFSLYDVASDIRQLKEAMGSIHEVSKIIGVSSGMLNQFLSVFKLPQPIINLVQNRQIDSVSMVHYLSKFDDNDLFALSEMLASGKLTSLDLRALIPYRKQYKNEGIYDLVERIEASKNIKVSVIRIYKEDTTKSLEELNIVFSKLIGNENIIKIDDINEFIDIKITKLGENRLREKAKQSNKTLKELISIVIQ